MMMGTENNRPHAVAAITASESAANHHGHQPSKKRRTVGLFGLQPRDGAVSVSPHHRNPGSTPSGLSISGGGCGYHCSYGLPETPSLPSRRTQSSGSFGSQAPVGLPDFIIAIPPIPDFQDSDDCGMYAGGRGTPRRTEANTLPNVRSLQAIRRYISTPPRG